MNSSFTVDLLTSRAVFIAVFALLALLFAGWRKTARASTNSLRRVVTPRLNRSPSGVPVEQQPLTMYRRPGLAHRMFSLGLAGAIAVIVGAVLAILISFAAVASVVRLTDLLG